MNLRPQMLGAVFHNHYTDIPRASHCGIIWEVRVGDDVPVTVTPVKPKYYLLGTLTVKQRHAVKLC
ncbi:unnamed protein product [Durusdinium trenchii]|uniref:Uncharacterized protein n=1 Tax=Durusdinium trenchii TaxID=1381693 RepID=A0ABP0PLS8_9DINO